jgi:hypothetical protein
LTVASYELYATILRKKCGFDGIAMSERLKNANIEGEKATRENKYPMVTA